MLRSMKSYERFSQRHNIKDGKLAEVLDYIERVCKDIKYINENEFEIDWDYSLKMYGDNFSFSWIIVWDKKILFDNYAWIYWSIKNIYA